MGVRNIYDIKTNLFYLENNARQTNSLHVSTTDLRQYHSFWQREQRLAANSPQTAHFGGSVMRLSNTSRLYVSAKLYIETDK